MSTAERVSMPSLRTRAYLIAVVSFAIVCGAAAVHRTIGLKRGDETVQLSIALAPESGPLPQAIEEAFETAVIDQESVAAVLAKLRLNSPASQRVAELRPADIADRLSIESAAVRPDTQTGVEDRIARDETTWGVVIRFRGDAELGNTLTREMATQFTHKYVFRPALAVQNRLNASIAAVDKETRQRAAADAARIDVEARLEYVRLALSELPEVEQLEQILAAPEIPASASSDATAAANATQAGDASRGLRDQLEQLHARLAEASEMYTPAHPALQNLARQRQILERELQSLEASNAGPVSNERLVESQQRRELARQSLAKRAELEGQLTELTAELEEQLEIAVQLDGSLAQLTAQQRLAEAEWLQHDQIEVVLLEPTREIELHGPANLTVVMFAMCLGAFGAVVVSTIGLPGDSILRTAEQTAQAVALPVIATLPSTEASPEAVPYQLPRGTRIAKLAAEVVIAVMLLCTTVLAIFRVGYLEQLAENPLVELADSVRTLWAFLVS